MKSLQNKGTRSDDNRIFIEQLFIVLKNSLDSFNILLKQRGEKNDDSFLQLIAIHPSLLSILWASLSVAATISARDIVRASLSIQFFSSSSSSPSSLSPFTFLPLPTRIHSVILNRFSGTHRVFPVCDAVSGILAKL